jgi:penicillin-binding protein 1B
MLPYTYGHTHNALFLIYVDAVRVAVFLVAIFAGLILSVLIFSAFWIYNIDQEWAPLIEPRIRERQEIGSVRILAEDASGQKQWIASLTSGRLEERKPVALADVPPLLIQSIVVLEDPRFLSHEGFDIWGIMRAAFAVLRTLRFSQGGGSTITQQLVKNIFLSPERTFRRKFTEIVIAALVEKRFTKDEILEAYINEIYMGQLGPLEVHGVGRAAEYYFNKNLSDLELHETALLAAIIASPGYYSPWKAPDRALRRRERVLRHLVEHKIILEEEFAEAAAKPLPQNTKLLGPTRAYYLVDALRERLLEERDEKELLKGGFDIVLDLDLELQRTAEESIRQFSQTYPDTQALIAAADPRTCRFKVYVGGTDYRLTQLDRIRQSKRSIGSLIKPLEILPLLEEDEALLNLGTKLEDRPLEWNYDRGRGKWSPENYDKKYRGVVTLREALEQSLNVPIVRVFFEREPNGTLNSFFEMARAMGLSIAPELALPSALLGTVEQRPWDMLLAYSKLVRQASGLSPNAPDLDCRLEFEKAASLPAELEGDAFGQKGARLMISALEGALRRGTSASLGAQLPSSQAWAGKTGTSGDKRDSWYVALSPELVVVAWVGRDDNKETVFTGASGALRIASPVIIKKAARTSAEGWRWPKPESVGLEWHPYDRDNFCRVGGLAEDDFAKDYPDKLAANGLPTEAVFKQRRVAYELFASERLAPTCNN